MDARFYNSDQIDIEQLANNLENVYRSQGFQVQQVGSNNQMMVQLKKGSDFEALIGLQAALSVILQRSGGGVIAMIGQQKWVDKAAIGAVGLIAAPILWPLMLTAGAGAIRQASLGNQVLNVVDGLVRQQRPAVQLGPIPVQIMPQLQQQWAPPPLPQPQAPYYVPSGTQVVISAAQPASLPGPTRLRCPSCNTPYEPGDTFCSGCGHPLIPPKTICPNCGSELKDNTSFCPKCGSSTFQATRAQAAAPAPPPVPPTVQTPTYTPPAAPKAPAYTPPPVAPKTPAYAPPQPVPQPYVPPVPQQPPVVSTPKVTYIPGTPAASAQTAPAAPQQPKQPDAPYYTPPADLQGTIQKPPMSAPTSAPAPAPIVARTASQPAADPNALWGMLTFSDGTQVKLSGERAVVGRYDHDIGGLEPEVDLSKMAGADTASRIHAAFEHVGSSYTLTDLNSTNSTRINGKRLQPDKATPINDGDTLTFGKVNCTFKKA